MKEWIERGKHDLEVAKILLVEEEYSDVVLFHIHQAVEKYLKTQSTRSSKTSIQWDHRNENKKTVENGIYVWHVTIDGVRHIRIVNDKQ